MAVRRSSAANPEAEPPDFVHCEGGPVSRRLTAM